MKLRNESFRAFGVMNSARTRFARRGAIGFVGSYGTMPHSDALIWERRMLMAPRIHSEWAAQLRYIAVLALPILPVCWPMIDTVGGSRLGLVFGARTIAGARKTVSRLPTAPISGSRSGGAQPRGPPRRC